MTQLESALKNKITPEMKKVAKNEGLSQNFIKDQIKKGLIVIPANPHHKGLLPRGIGKGLKVKINANIGVSPLLSNLAEEIKKLKVVEEAGADAVMDLSISPKIDKIRKALIKKTAVPFGTVPLYQAVIEAGDIKNATIKKYLEVLEKQAKDGVDFVTIHSGVRQQIFPKLESRVMKCVSRGGSLLLAWMRHHKKENFLYTHFDDILEIAREYDMTLSLGDGMRPGCIADATDKAQLDELKTLGKLTQRARLAGVQVMIEGPGHIPLNEIEKNIKLQKKYCDNAPFYVLGPLPTDIAAGHDHIACAIGGSLAAWHGADFLCYVTPKEHIGLPNIADAREGVIASKIAAHIADVARGNKEALKKNLKMAQARYDIDWEEMAKHALDPKRFIKLRMQECQKNPKLKKSGKYCSMCGPFCAYKTYQ